MRERTSATLTVALYNYVHRGKEFDDAKMIESVTPLKTHFLYNASAFTDATMYDTKKSEKNSADHAHKFSCYRFEKEAEIEELLNIR